MLINCVLLNVTFALNPSCTAPIFHIVFLPIQDINTSCIITDNVKEFGDGDNTDFETVFVLEDFDSPDYSYLYKRDNRIVGPPVVLHCAAKEEVSD